MYYGYGSNGSMGNGFEYGYGSMGNGFGGYGYGGSNGGQGYGGSNGGAQGGFGMGYGSKDGAWKEQYVLLLKQIANLIEFLYDQDGAERTVFLINKFFYGDDPTVTIKDFVEEDSD